MHNLDPISNYFAKFKAVAFKNRFDVLFDKGMVVLQPKGEWTVDHVTKTPATF